jgi:hypothetical protein
VDCQRLFQLRYLEHVSWPAQEIESSIETERYLELGSSFHQMVQQYYLGVDPKYLTTMAVRDPLLNRWWNNFLQYKPAPDGHSHYVEFPLSIPIDQYRLVAKYDLLLQRNSSSGLNKYSRTTQDGKTENNHVKWIIYDWKTTHKLPERQWLSTKLQTRIYPFLLTKAGLSMDHDRGIKPENIQMVYWFSNFPEMPIQFRYSQEYFEKDQSFIMKLIDEIKTLDGKESPKTENEKRCRFCAYRSLCDRGIVAGSLTEYQFDEPFQDTISDSILEIDFDQIVEISF